MKKAKKISKETTSRSEFNGAYKAYLEHTGKIHCGRCPYNRGENDTRKFYSIDTRTNGHIMGRHPNWKLVSKNRKQWMQKPTKKNFIILAGINTLTFASLGDAIWRDSSVGKVMES